MLKQSKEAMYSSAILMVLVFHAAALAQNASEVLATVRVVNSQNQPIAGARVNAYPVYTGSNLEYIPAVAQRPVITNQSGNASLRLDPGSYQVEVSPLGATSAVIRRVTISRQSPTVTITVPSAPLVVEPPGAFDSPDVVVPSLPQISYAKLTVQIVNEQLSRNAAKGQRSGSNGVLIRVHKQSNPAWSWNLSTNADGVAQVTLPLGDYQVTISRPGYFSKTTNVSLRSAGTVPLRFSARDGRRLNPAPVIFQTLPYRIDGKWVQPFEVRRQEPK